MITQSPASSTHDAIILRAARMGVRHHPSIPPVRPVSSINAFKGRYISVRMSRDPVEAK